MYHRDKHSETDKTKQCVSDGERHRLCDRMELLNNRGVCRESSKLY